MEDDLPIRRLLVTLLTSVGYTVSHAADGEAALAACAARAPDAIFLDLNLPGTLSGWDVLARLRAMHGGLPVVLLSADPDAIRRARQAGASAAILKPFDIDEVLEIAERLVDAPINQGRPAIGSRQLELGES